ncbi:hypothetical protein P0Y43_01045 [Pseudomonas entomophila]|uniref:hypothetical protein n=1 Tax=Pseudomonas entomophila TaxID=312306 RepID=UPI0023D8C1D2|nr:hypothetical protein [Pseudomonas entomophila]MDF0729310.1 hypothetical protein [Pseudomonas entomophila]
MDTFLRRYTELPFLIDYLQTRELVLLDPATWDDRNDAYYIEQYARLKGYQRTYALCLAEASETYHHWRVFSHGSSGVCVEFHQERLLAAVLKVEGLRAEKVRYGKMADLSARAPQQDELPFIKRHAFGDEKEFRLFHCSVEAGPPVMRVSVPLNCISRITLSPWLPASVADHVKTTLKAIPGCSKLRIYRSTLVENQRWKKFAGPAPA